MAEVAIDTKRLARIKKLTEGSHNNARAGFCVMEAVAYVAREPWSDHPQCASPVIAAFLRRWNDALPTDEDRARLLLPLIPRLVGTRGSEALENRRATMAADWLVRIHTPAWLRLAGLTAEADALASLPEITDFAKTSSIIEPLKVARKAASAAGGAAWGAAGAAAKDAAKDAAGDAAGAAAWGAAWAALKPTVAELQQSAMRLVERMCELSEAA